MVDSMYEPTPPKRLCLVNESSSPSFSELSVNNEQNTYSLRKKRQHSPIKSRLRIRALLDYGFEDPEANGIQPQKDGIQIEKRVTRSSNIENEDQKIALPLIPLDSNLVVSITDSDYIRGIAELSVHILIDSNLSIPTKTDILTPNFSIISQNMQNHSLNSIEDISDSSFINRHRKKELFEKKTKNRAKEVYRYELYSKMLKESSSNLKSESSLVNFEKNVETDQEWYKDLIQGKEKAVFRVGVFNGQELWGIEQDRLEELIKSKEIQSDYLPVNTPIETMELSCKKDRSTRKKISK